MDIPDTLTMGDAARILGLTKARVSQLASAGRLEAVVVDGRKMIRASSIESYKTISCAASAQKKCFVLMAANYEVAVVRYDTSSDSPFAVSEVLDAARMPFGTVTSGGRVRPREFNGWWEHRSVPDARPGLLARLSELGLRWSWQVPVQSLGLSLSDYYWLRPADCEGLTWQALNYFENDFAGSGDGTWDRWLANVGLASPDNTSEGEQPKRWVIRSGARILIKGCRSDDQRPWNEVVATALHRRLLGHDDYVVYEPMCVGEEAACACADFLRSREEYIPAAYLKNSLGRTRGDSVCDRLCRYAGTLGAGEDRVRERMAKMIVCDSLIANSDRHWRNFGFIRDVDTLAIRPAPIFDSGNSLWFEKSAAEVRAKDWSFAARPFGPEPERQLALAQPCDWFDPMALDGFADEAAELLAKSAHACAPGRLDYITEGVRERVRDVTAALAVLRYR